MMIIIRCHIQAACLWGLLSKRMCTVVILMWSDILCIRSTQKVADNKGVNAKKGGAKGKKDDGPAQNGETKTNEVWGLENEKKERT